MKKLVDRFTAIDPTGNKYTVECYQEFITSTYLDGSSETLPGRKEYRIAGRPISYIDDNTFQIIGQEAHIKKVA